uniref:Uncharacterized protein n=1 Tax=Arundo donax TaxID=35708 RepID=A0A0A9HBM7_ARUDO
MHAASVFCSPFFLQHDNQIHPQQVLSKLPLIAARARATYARPGDLPDSPAPLLWIGSGPLGTLLLLLLNVPSSSKSSIVLSEDNPPLAPIIILLPPTAARLTGDAAFPLLCTTNDTKTRPPSRMANAAADAHLADLASLLIILSYFH